MNALSNEELKRYARHLSLPRFGRESQKKLKEARVLVVGAGGLGAPLLQYLTAAGVGHMGIVDFDRIDLSNLQRQVLFGTSEVGKLKTETAIRKLQDQNPHVNFRIYNERLTSANALEIIGDYDIVADGTDQIPRKRCMCTVEQGKCVCLHIPV